MKQPAVIKLPPFNQILIPELISPLKFPVGFEKNFEKKFKSPDKFYRYKPLMTLIELKLTP